MKFEKRTNTVEIRSDEPTQTDETDEQKGEAGKTISGYAILYDTPSKPMEAGDATFTETIAKGALNGVDFSDLAMFYNHDYAKILASVKAGTLEVTSDDKGLAFKATLTDTTLADDVYKNIEAGNLDSMSFGFTVGEDDWEQGDDGNYTRTVTKIDNLYELSVVAFPAYDETDVSVDTRSLDLFKQEKQKEKERTEMFKNVDDTTTAITPEKAFEKYIRSAGHIDGETRAALTTTEAAPVIPQNVITPVFEQKDNPNALANLATVLTVSNNAGSLPVVTADDTTVLATKAEAAEMGDVAYTITNVDYKVQTRAGRIVISDEARDDSAVNIVELCKKQLAKLVQNTDNQNILKLLATLPAKTAANVDDLKKLYNVDLNPNLSDSATWIVNSTAFNALDQLKDTQGRYLLQPDVTAASGFAFLGRPVVRVADKVWAAAISGGKGANMVLADVAQTVAVFRRTQVAFDWEKFDNYAEGLAVVTRDDYKLIDKTAGFAITFNTAA